MHEFGLSDEQLFPLADDASRTMLRILREHPHAPRYNWRTGERLTAEGLTRIYEYAARLRTDRRVWQPGETPAWLLEFVRSCRRDVPFYRTRNDWSDDFYALPLTERSDIRREPWAFVPDSFPIDDLIVYTTSGTAGTRLQIPASAELPNRYLPLFEWVLETCDVRLDGGQRVSIVQVCAQRGTVVLCSISSYLKGAGFAKVNLQPDGWNNAGDDVRFLEDCDPELITGDPFALWKLLHHPAGLRPKAILSSGTSLSSGLRQALSDRFRCPVIDVYSMNETGPIAFSTDGSAHEVLPHQLFVEILDPAGHPCRAGERGEIVLTGGLNRYLPLVRYATGDFAAMEHPPGGMPRLVGFHGRKPVAFRGDAGQWISSIDASTALTHLPLPYVSLLQRTDGSFLLQTTGDAENVAAAVEALRGLLGPGIRLEVNCDFDEIPAGKPISFRSDLASPFGD